MTWSSWNWYLNSPRRWPSSNTFIPSMTTLTKCSVHLSALLLIIQCFIMWPQVTSNILIWTLIFQVTLFWLFTRVENGFCPSSKLLSFHHNRNFLDISPILMNGSCLRDADYFHKLLYLHFDPFLKRVYVICNWYSRTRKAVLSAQKPYKTRKLLA